MDSNNINNLLSNIIQLQNSFFTHDSSSYMKDVYQAKKNVFILLIDFLLKSVKESALESCKTLPMLLGLCNSVIVAATKFLETYEWQSILANDADFKE